MQIKQPKAEFDRLQQKFGDASLRAIYGAGCLQNPKVCFIFMNPTGRNVSAHAGWKGLRAPWLGTKNVWKLFAQLKLLSPDIYNLIQKMSAEEWDESFANRVYQEISNQQAYITNLSKSTQNDARPLPDYVFRAYLPLLLQEIDAIRPKIIISFGNQVSSIILSRPIKVSECRKTSLPLHINGVIYSVYPTYYPVGQGMRNMQKAINDIRWAIANNVR